MRDTIKSVKLFDIFLEYPSSWELHFGKPPTEQVGGFEVLLKQDYKITVAICVVWRPCDDVIIDSLIEKKYGKVGLIKYIATLLGKEPVNSLKCGKSKKFSDEEILALYCDGVYANIEKEQGTVTLLKREILQFNGHRAESSEFTFPVNKRKKKLGDLYRMQLGLKCNESNRFVVIYTSSQKKMRDASLVQINDVIQSLRCHDF